MEILLENEINRLKAEKEADLRIHEAEINRVTDAFLRFFIIETKRDVPVECHPDRRFRVIWSPGGDRWFRTYEEAKQALLGAIML